MARLAGQTRISLSELKQTINLNRRAGRKLSLEELQDFAEEAIERINQRTLSGEQVGGGSFVPYSESYADKKGVSRNAVDLFLDGDMLNSLNYEIDDSRGTVEIFLDGAEVETLKGYAHHRGDGNMPRRPWFGITPDETRELLASIADEAEAAPRPERITLADLIRAVGTIGLE